MRNLLPRGCELRVGTNKDVQCRTTLFRVHSEYETKTGEVIRCHIGGLDSSP